MFIIRWVTVKQYNLQTNNKSHPNKRLDKNQNHTWKSLNHIMFCSASISVSQDFLWHTRQMVPVFFLNNVDFCLSLSLLGPCPPCTATHNGAPTWTERCPGCQVLGLGWKKLWPGWVRVWRESTSLSLISGESWPLLGSWNRYFTNIQDKDKRKLT